MPLWLVLSKALFLAFRWCVLTCGKRREVEKGGERERRKEREREREKGKRERDKRYILLRRPQFID